MARDILLNQLFGNGDLNVNEADEQSASNVVLLSPGQMKNVPLVGVNINNYVHSPMNQQIAQELTRDIRMHLAADGAQQIKVAVDALSTNVNVDATY